MGRRNLGAALTIVVTLLAILLALAGIIALGSRLDLGGAQSAQGSTNVSLIATLLGAEVMVCLFAALEWIGIEARANDEPISPLYWPMLATKLWLVCYLLTTAPQVLDFLAHDERPHWKPLYTPLVRDAQSGFLVLIFVSFGGIVAVLLQAKGWSRRRIGALFAAILLLCAALTIAVVALGANDII